MLDLSKYDDKSFFELSSETLKKINDNIFILFKKFKNFNSSEDRYIFNKLKTDFSLK
jgi:hypothetical protein